jgi:hypothetical protein
VAGFIPKCNVPLDSIVDGSSLLAEPKRLTAAGVETLVEVDTAGEHKRPAVTGVDAQLVVTVVLPKVNKLFVASVATGFG